MDLIITPSKLKGTVTVPPSKSQAHRLLICAALAEGVSHISNISLSKDIEATIGALRALGAEISVDGSTATVKGISRCPESAEIDCFESGSTLRFMIPVACALGVKTVFRGRGKLPQRPITTYLDELPKHGAVFDYSGTMPFCVSGKLSAGTYHMSGSVSSQFITGLILALAVTEGESEVILTSKLESKPYVDITLGCLKLFGAQAEQTDKGYRIKGKGRLKAADTAVEGDYSQAAFFYAANCLGSEIEILGLNVNSFQGDKKVIEICEQMVYNSDNGLRPYQLDCSDIPDLVPALAVLGAYANGQSRIYNAARLRIKESDRIASSVDMICGLGGSACGTEDGLLIDGKEFLSGGTVDSCNDHRIAMAAAVGSVGCKGEVLVRGAECVSKSYPDFWEVFARLGGKVASADQE